MLFVFFLSSRVKLSHTEVSTPLHVREFAVRIFRKNLPWLFEAGTCHGNLSQEFAVVICHENLPQDFAVAIFCVNLPFAFVSESSFLYVNKSCYMKGNLFCMWAKLFLFARFSLLTVFLFVIAVAVMGHRTYTIGSVPYLTLFYLFLISTAA